MAVAPSFLYYIEMTWSCSLWLVILFITGYLPRDWSSPSWLVISLIRRGHENEASSAVCLILPLQKRIMGLFFFFLLLFLLVLLIFLFFFFYFISVAFVGFFVWGAKPTNFTLNIYVIKHIKFKLVKRNVKLQCKTVYIDLVYFEHFVSKIWFLHIDLKAIFNIGAAQTTFGIWGLNQFFFMIWGGLAIP